MSGYETRKPTIPLDVFTSERGYGITPKILGDLGSSVIGTEYDSNNKKTELAEQGMINFTKQGKQYNVIGIRVPDGKNPDDFVRELAETADYRVTIEDGQYVLTKGRTTLVMKPEKVEHESISGINTSSVILEFAYAIIS